MTQRYNIILLFGLLITFTGVGYVKASDSSAVEQVIQHGFPDQPGALAGTTQSLFMEYKATNNVLSLVFYSYGMLRQANHYLMANDIIRASEFAKTGFFYLDEAVELHEDNPKVRYMRARVDAWLTTDKGRCVITLKDTDLMLKNTSAFNAALLAHINVMRYRALMNCNEPQQATVLLEKMKRESPHSAAVLNSGNAPEWDMNEVTQILLPLVKGK